MVADSHKKDTAKTEENRDERRDFPRYKAGSMVHYFTSDIGEWCEAELVDFSAGGALFQCDRSLQSNTEITIHIMSNNLSSVPVPAMIAPAMVVRCISGENNSFEIACKFTYVVTESDLDAVGKDKD